MENTLKHIKTIKDLHQNKKQEENRSELRPIIEMFIFWAEQELPLRGDIDSDPLFLEKPLSKDGNFRSLLRFTVSFGDENLRKYATYINPKIQNEVCN